MSNLFPGQFQPLGFESISVTNAAVSQMTAPRGAKMALVQALTNTVNWRDDGVDPTTSAGGGMVINTSAEPITFIGNIRSAKFISTNAGGSKLVVSYYG
jgi:hypothetical protein